MQVLHNDFLCVSTAYENALATCFLASADGSGGRHFLAPTSTHLSASLRLTPNSLKFLAVRHAAVCLPGSSWPSKMNLLFATLRCGRMLRRFKVSAFFSGVTDPTAGAGM